MEDFIRPYKDLYFKSPFWFKQLSGNAIRLLSPNIRYGKTYKQVTEILQKSQWWDEEEILQYQRNALLSVLSNAASTVPFYKTLFTSFEINWEKEDPFVILNELPFISREMIRSSLNDFVNSTVPKSKLIYTTTGGSTGTPMKFFHEKGVTNPAERAFQWRQREWVKYHYGDPVVIIRGRGLGSGNWFAYEPAENALIISGYYLDEIHFPDIIKKILDFHPKALQAYPSNATLLANYMRKNNIAPPETLKVVLCGSENLFTFQRTILEQVFQCRIYSWYGQTEYVVLAGGCNISDSYHIYPEYGITELIRPNGTVIEGPNEMGEIVGTSFFNNAMPFIRYRTGDLASYEDGYCKCGRKYRRFKEVFGREQDFIVTADKRVISLTGLIFGQHFKAFEKIEKFQLLQSESGFLTILIVHNGEFGARDQQEIEIVFQNCLGSGLVTKFEYVSQIPLTPSGKYMFLKQKLDITKYF